MQITGGDFMGKPKRSTKEEFSAYLRRAVKNTTISYANDRDKINQHEAGWEEDIENAEEMRDELVRVSSNILENLNGDHLFKQITDKTLLTILKNLSALHINVLCMRILYEKSFDDIGKMIGISGKKAENTYYNAIKKIRRELGERKDAGKRI